MTFDIDIYNLRMSPKEDTRKPFLNEFLKMCMPRVAFALSAQVRSHVRTMDILPNGKISDSRYQDKETGTTGGYYPIQIESPSAATLQLSIEEP